MTLPAAPRRRAPRQAPRWANFAALDLHLRPATVEARVHGTSRVSVQEEAAGIIRRALEFGAPEVAEKVYSRIEAAYAGIEVPELTDTLIRDVQAADLSEDLSEAEFHRLPTNEAKRAWIAALRVQRATSLRLLMALEAV